MKKSKIYLFLIVFIIVGICFTNQVYAFSKGDTVKCKIKSYHYELKAGFSGNHYERIGEDDFFEKGTVVTYVESMNYGALQDNVCKVEYKGKNYYIKEVNLESFSNDSFTAANKTAEQIYNKYKDTDFSKIAPYELKSISDTLIQAKNSTTDTSLKLKLNELIQEIAELARNYGMEVSNDGTIRRCID